MEKEITETQVVSKFFRPYDTDIKLHFFGSNIEFCRLLLKGEQQKKIAVFSYGIIELIQESRIEDHPAEAEAFGKEVYETMIDSLPFTQGAGYAVHELHKSGCPIAAELVAHLAEFYKFSFDSHDLHLWRSIVSHF